MEKKIFSLVPKADELKELYSERHKKVVEKLNSQKWFNLSFKRIQRALHKKGVMSMSYYPTCFNLSDQFQFSVQLNKNVTIKETLKAVALCMNGHKRRVCYTDKQDWVYVIKWQLKPSDEEIEKGSTNIDILLHIYPDSATCKWQKVGEKDVERKPKLEDLKKILEENGIEIPEKVKAKEDVFDLICGDEGENDVTE